MLCLHDVVGHHTHNLSWTTPPQSQLVGMPCDLTNENKIAHGELLQLDSLLLGMSLSGLPSLLGTCRGKVAVQLVQSLLELSHVLLSRFVEPVDVGNFLGDWV